MELLAGFIFSPFKMAKIRRFGFSKSNKEIKKFSSNRKTQRKIKRAKKEFFDLKREVMRLEKTLMEKLELIAAECVLLREARDRQEDENRRLKWDLDRIKVIIINLLNRRGKEPEQ